jgi:uncharacterized protein (TIGR03067 family)
VLVVLFVPVPEPPPAKPVEPDHKRFQGEWHVVSVSRRGKAEDDDAASHVVVFSGNNLARVRPDGHRHEATMKLDVTKSPRQIVFSEQNRTYTGIYEFEGDTLKIAVREGNTPPKDFKNMGDEILMVLKRK